MKVITIAQSDGATRYLALTHGDADAVRSDRAMIDAVTPLACMEVDPDGHATWEETLRCPDTTEGREAIRAHRRGEG